MPCIEDIDYRFPTLPPTLPLLKIMPFTPLGLSPELLNALAERHYAQPTAIQTAAIPSILQGRDVRACAQTGSGKTAAFGLPLLHLLQQRMTTVLAKQGVLILVPTRELAAQVGGTLFALAAHFPKRPKICAVFGGVSINPQMMRLRGGADVVVATPGRLLDLVAHNAIELGSFATLVLDEADRLFDLGFAEELERILALLPAKRQNLFFSATFPPKVQALADTLLHDPVRIDLPPDDALKPAITQRAFRVDADKRTRLLRHLIKEHAWSRVLVFVATKFAAEIVADKLRKDSINAEPFHGVLSQGKRTQVLQDFKASRVSVVVATDMAARGIDIAGLPVVMNYDLPRSAVDYVHRIGRTCRSGLEGLAGSFITADAEAHCKLIEKRQGGTGARAVLAGFEPTEAALPAGTPAPGVHVPGVGGVKGKRPSKKDKLRALALAEGSEFSEG